MSQDPKYAAGIIHVALLSGQLILAVVAILTERSVQPPEGLNAEVLLTVNFVVVAGTLIASHFAGRILLRTARVGNDESDRMAGGLRAFIVRMAILEAGGLIALLSYLFTGEISFMGVFGIVLVAFLFAKPSDSDWESVQKGTQSQSSNQ